MCKFRRVCIFARQSGAKHNPIVRTSELSQFWAQTVLKLKLDIIKKPENQMHRQIPTGPCVKPNSWQGHSSVPSPTPQCTPSPHNPHYTCTLLYTPSLPLLSPIVEEGSVHKRKRWDECERKGLIYSSRFILDSVKAHDVRKASLA